MADFDDGLLECKVSKPQKENEGTKDAYISYQVTTRTNFQSFQRPETNVRRRFTDFLFLYSTLCREYPAVAVPPLPEKHNMAYVRGDRFGLDFTERRAHSLHRFLRRIALHPDLRRSAILLQFLESPEWHATMRARPQRVDSTSTTHAPGAASSGGVLDSITDTFLNAFSKVHKPDRRFLEVRDKADKLDEDLGHVEKIVARVARRESDLEADYADLAAQFQKLVTLEPGVEQALTGFAAGLDATAKDFRELKNHTDRNYLGSLRDMSAYVASLKALLKAREQKQLDFEGLTEYLAKAAADRDHLASSVGSSTSASASHHGSTSHGSSSASASPHHYTPPASSNPLAALRDNATGFLRSRIEDVRGVDHATARRDRLRRLELEIGRLTREVEAAKVVSESFDDKTVAEVAEFDRIRAAEMKDTLGELADRHIAYFKGVEETWEKFIAEMERDGESEGRVGQEAGR